MSADSQKLDLPVELERKIFELAAKGDTETALRLAVVSRRVQAWIEPMIYSRVVVARPPEDDTCAIRRHRALTESRQAGRELVWTNEPQDFCFIRTISMRPPLFFCRNVKVLHVGELTESELVTLLSTCTGISELGWWLSIPTETLLPALNNLTLCRLSVDYTYDFDLPGIRQHWTTITHLDLTAALMHIPELPPLQHFPALTHFSIASIGVSPPETWSDEILTVCPRLKILLHLSSVMYFDEMTGFRREHPDLRVVVAHPPTGTWSTNRVHDVWPLAEDIVRKRMEAAAVGKSMSAVAHSENS